MKIILLTLALFYTTFGDNADNSVDIYSIPVCATLNNVYRTFENILEIYNEFKTTGQLWEPVATNACPTTTDDCLRLSPVCAVSSDNFYKTFPNQCVLEAEQKSTGTKWNIVFNGICSVNPGDGFVESEAVPLSSQNLQNENIAQQPTNSLVLSTSDEYNQQSIQDQSQQALQPQFSTFEADYKQIPADGQSDQFSAQKPASDLALPLTNNFNQISAQVPPEPSSPPSYSSISLSSKPNNIIQKPQPSSTYSISSYAPAGYGKELVQNQAKPSLLQSPSNDSALSPVVVPNKPSQYPTAKTSSQSSAPVQSEDYTLLNSGQPNVFKTETNSPNAGNYIQQLLQAPTDQVYSSSIEDVGQRIDSQQFNENSAKLPSTYLILPFYHNLNVVSSPYQSKQTLFLPYSSSLYNKPSIQIQPMQVVLPSYPFREANASQSTADGFNQNAAQLPENTASFSGSFNQLYSQKQPEEIKTSSYTSSVSSALNSAYNNKEQEPQSAVRYEAKKAKADNYGRGSAQTPIDQTPKLPYALSPNNAASPLVSAQQPESATSLTKYPSSLVQSQYKPELFANEKPIQNTAELSTSVQAQSPQFNRNSAQFPTNSLPSTSSNNLNQVSTPNQPDRTAVDSYSSSSVSNVAPFASGQYNPFLEIELSKSQFNKNSAQLPTGSSSSTGNVNHISEVNQPKQARLPSYNAASSTPVSGQQLKSSASYPTSLSVNNAQIDSSSLNNYKLSSVKTQPEPAVVLASGQYNQNTVELPKSLQSQAKQTSYQLPSQVNQNSAQLSKSSLARPFYSNYKWIPAQSRTETYSKDSYSSSQYNVQGSILPSNSASTDDIVQPIPSRQLNQNSAQLPGNDKNLSGSSNQVQLEQVQEKTVQGISPSYIIAQSDAASSANSRLYNSIQGKQSMPSHAPERISATYEETTLSRNGFSSYDAAHTAESERYRSALQQKYSPRYPVSVDISTSYGKGAAQVGDKQNPLASNPLPSANAAQSLINRQLNQNLVQLPKSSAIYPGNSYQMSGHVQSEQEISDPHTSVSSSPISTGNILVTNPQDISYKPGDVNYRQGYTQSQNEIAHLKSNVSSSDDAAYSTSAQEPHVLAPCSSFSAGAGDSGSSSTQIRPEAAAQASYGAEHALVSEHYNSAKDKNPSPINSVSSAVSTSYVKDTVQLSQDTAQLQGNSVTSSRNYNHSPNQNNIKRTELASCSVSSSVASENNNLVHQLQSLPTYSIDNNSPSSYGQDFAQTQTKVAPSYASAPYDNGRSPASKYYNTVQEQESLTASPVVYPIPTNYNSNSTHVQVKQSPLPTNASSSYDAAYYLVSENNNLNQEHNPSSVYPATYIVPNPNYNNHSERFPQAQAPSPSYEPYQTIRELQPLPTNYSAPSSNSDSYGQSSTYTQSKQGAVSISSSSSCDTPQLTQSNNASSRIPANYDKSYALSQPERNPALSQPEQTRFYDSSSRGVALSPASGDYNLVEQSAPVQPAYVPLASYSSSVPGVLDSPTSAQSKENSAEIPTNPLDSSHFDKPTQDLADSYFSSNNNYNSDEQSSPNSVPCSNAEAYISPVLQNQNTLSHSQIFNDTSMPSDIHSDTMNKKSQSELLKLNENDSNLNKTQVNNDDDSSNPNNQNDSQTIYNGVVYQGPYYYEPKYKHINFGNFNFLPAQNFAPVPVTPADSEVLADNYQAPVAVADNNGYNTNPFEQLLRQLQYIASKNDRPSY